MQNNVRFQSLLFHTATCAATAALTTAIVLALICTFTQSAQGQTFKVLHNFTGGQDGGTPSAGLTIDNAGNLYGTAESGGSGSGTVFRLVRRGSAWIFTPLYSFAGGSDGANPSGTVIFGPNGALYGTTLDGGTGGCYFGACGTVFNLKPPPTACKTAICPWTETVLYRFAGDPDGGSPAGGLIFDQVGNMYGTTDFGGVGGGTIFEMTPSNGSWEESVLHALSDGTHPFSGVIFDNAGNLYGTTTGGGDDYVGAVFELSPSGSGWTEKVLYSFHRDSGGNTPYAGLIFDQSGNLYGAAINGGSGGGGTIFKLIPSNGSWTYKVIYSFTGGIECGPGGSLVMDGAGNLYGTTLCDGANQAGSVFRLTPSGNGWTYTSLYDFTNGSDGGSPYCSVVFDAYGNLYGTTEHGGLRGGGVVFEITP
jgi:uncharacterized repeat protein (TIGR03803 family)